MADGLMTAMVDKAMTEAQGLHPPLRRSDCERIIRSALGWKPAGKADIAEIVARHVDWLRMYPDRTRCEVFTADLRAILGDRERALDALREIAERQPLATAGMFREFARTFLAPLKEPSHDSH